MRYLCANDPLTVAPAVMASRVNDIAYWARLGVSSAVLNMHLRQLDWEHDQPVQMSENTVTRRNTHNALR